MYYMNARYYDPSLAVFICPDPSMSGSNHYAYANCNPVMYNDPTGMYYQAEDYSSYYSQCYGYRDSNGTTDSNYYQGSTSSSITESSITSVLNTEISSATNDTLIDSIVANADRDSIENWNSLIGIDWENDNDNDNDNNLNLEAQDIVNVLTEVINSDDVQPGYPDANGNTDRTWCNRALERTLRNLGCDTSNLLTDNPFSGNPDINWTSANSIVDNTYDDWIMGGNLVRINGEREFVERSSQLFANRGNIVIAIWKNPTGASGHVAIVSPTNDIFNPTNGPLVGQAGAVNGFMNLQNGFGVARNSVQFYIINRFYE